MRVIKKITLEENIVCSCKGNEKEILFFTVTGSIFAFDYSELNENISNYLFYIENPKKNSDQIGKFNDKDFIHV